MVDLVEVVTPFNQVTFHQLKCHVPTCSLEKQFNGSFCAKHVDSIQGLQILQNPKGQLGLFATKVFKTGEVIGVVNGTTRDLQSLKVSHQDEGYHRYMFKVGNQYMDCTNHGDCNSACHVEHSITHDNTQLVLGSAIDGMTRLYLVAKMKIEVGDHLKANLQPFIVA